MVALNRGAGGTVRKEIGTPLGIMALAFRVPRHAIYAPGAVVGGFALKTDATIK